MRLAVFDNVLLQREVAVCGLGGVHRQTGLHAERSELVPVGGAVSIVVDLIEHLLQHRDGVRSLDVFNDARVSLEQLLEQHLSELSDRQAVALLELFLQLGQGVGAEGSANVHNARKQTGAKFLKGRHCANHEQLQLFLFVFAARHEERLHEGSNGPARRVGRFIPTVFVQHAQGHTLIVFPGSGRYFEYGSILSRVCVFCW
mmetsp:Transcript_42789/g.74409  ORF Transcript_42789/g.74409 Transcript_42789/m.74409 type:complete len:202 (+) Transcript_42789:286-891(+)